MSDDQVERKRQRWRKAYADRRAAETADQRAVRLVTERARRRQDNEATERRLERRRQAYADRRAVETADQRAMHLAAERARRARKRQQTTEATGQPEQGPAAGPSRVQEPRVLPRPVSVSVAATPTETADQRSVRLAAERTRRARKRQQTTEATEQYEPEQQPEQGPAAGPARVQEPRVPPRPASTSVEARPPETADQRSVRLAIERTRRARKREQTAEATGQPEPEQQPEQGPAAGPARVQEPLVIPRQASASVEPRPPETADQRAVRVSEEQVRRTQDAEAKERKLHRRRQTHANRKAAETANQRKVRLVAERTRRARKRQQTTEATEQYEPEQQPEQGPVAGPSRVQEPRVLPRPALASVAASRIPALDQRRYNRPTADEVAGIFIVPPGGSITYGRDLVVQERHTLHLKQVFEQNQMFDTMQYPLLHPYGEVGWSIGIPKRRRGANQRITTLYVALSRVTSRANVKLLIVDPPHTEEDGAYTRNVVYSSVLEHAA
uniref:Uncharacterized protein n=2 Tax=Anopheles atroparvus TaxID=41427 RepID=A0A182J6S5_ANOAO